MVDVNFGNPKSNTAIVTLWSDRSKVIPKLDSTKYAIIGNLYSSNGINYMIKTLLAYPSIRHLIVWGFSLTKSDADLFTLWKDGCNGEMKIPGTKIAILIDRELIDIVRKNVQLIDMRGRPLAEMQNVLEGLSLKLDKTYAEPMDVELKPEAPVETIPSPLSGHFIYEESVFGAWIKLLNYVLKFGDVKETEYGTKQKEYNNLMVTIGKNFDFVEYGFRDLFTSEELDNYIKTQIMTRTHSNLDISYIYGERLFNYNGIDQIDFIINKLGTNPETRRAVAVLWNPQTDAENPHGPCLNFLSFNIHHNEVYATIIFRSQDIFKAWPKNTLGLMHLQKHITEELNKRYGKQYKPGKFTITSISAHIYSEDWAEAKNYVDNHLSIIQRLNVDPKGLFVVMIDTDKNMIRIEYRSNQGELLQVFEGQSGEELYKEISNNDVFSFFVHSAYLGYQISKAETCLRLGVQFVQDKAPDSNN